MSSKQTLLQGNVPSSIRNTFTQGRSHPPRYFAELYKANRLEGGHVIMLGAGNDDAAKEALAAWPGKFSTEDVNHFLNPLTGALQVGGGITDQNCLQWLDAGASKVFYLCV